MVIGTEPGARPARAAPASISARLAAMRSGVAQFSSAPSAVSPASRSICGPSAARYTGAAGRSFTPSEADRGHPGAPGHAGPATTSPGGDLLAVQQRPDLGHVLAHDRDRAVGQAHRRPERRARSPRCPGRARTGPRTAGPAWPPAGPGSAGSTSAPPGRRRSRCAARCPATRPRRRGTSPAPSRPGSTGSRSRRGRLPGRRPQFVERQAEPAIQSRANHHDRQYAPLPARRLWPGLGRPRPDEPSRRFSSCRVRPCWPGRSAVCSVTCSPHLVCADDPRSDRAPHPVALLSWPRAGTVTGCRVSRYSRSESFHAISITRSPLTARASQPGPGDDHDASGHPGDRAAVTARGGLGGGRRTEARP